MSESKYTPGPWKAAIMDQPLDSPTVLVILGEDRIVCAIHDADIEDADLALILAAPDLYEALETTCEYCIGKEATDCPCERCITGKALRKARGEE